MTPKSVSQSDNKNVSHCLMFCCCYICIGSLTYKLKNIDVKRFGEIERKVCAIVMRDIFFTLIVRTSDLVMDRWPRSNG